MSANADARGRRRVLAAGARGLAVAALLASPLLALDLIPALGASRTLAFVATRGHWLVLLGALAGGIAIARSRAGRSPAGVWSRLETVFARLPPARLAWAVTTLALLVYLDLVPSHRRHGPVAGDEPKYLRMAESLCRDLDAEIAPVDEGASPPRASASGRLETGGGRGPESTGTRRLEGARRLVRAAGGAIGSLLRAESPPPDHDWVVGDFTDWILRGWKGGHWYMQSLGLPFLLAPAACIDVRIGDSYAPGAFAFATLGLLWAFGLAQTVRLGAELSGSTLAGLVAGAATAFSAPLLVAAWHVYPEVAAAAAVPWLLRYARAGGPDPRGRQVLALGVVAGGLPWLHPKFLFLALCLIALLLVRLRRRPRVLLLGGAGFAVPLLALFLFEYHLTGLLRPEARYARHGDDVYRGPTQFFSRDVPVGAVNATVGARQGLFVMAPVLVAGLLSSPLVWRRRRGDALELLAVFLSLLVAASVAGGHAPGPPSRLLSPVACVPAAVLAVGLVERRGWLPFRWTVLALALTSLAIATSMSYEWRRINNPWRGIPEAADVSRDLPASPQALRSPPRWVLPPLVLGAIVAVGARAVARARAASRIPDGVERDVLAVHVGWWSSILAFAAGLAVVHL